MSEDSRATVGKGELGIARCGHRRSGLDPESQPGDREAGVQHVVAVRDMAREAGAKRGAVGVRKTSETGRQPIGFVALYSST